MKTVSTAALKEFVAACAQPGCPVCRSAETETRRYLRDLFYEYVNDTGVRKDLRGSLGFCNLHAWQAVDQNLGNAFGFAIIYEDLVGHALEHFGRGKPSSANTAKLRPKHDCPACRVWEHSCQASIELILKSTADPDLLHAFRDSEGLCLSHLTQLMTLNTETQDISSLLTLHREKLTKLQKELREFIRKNDHRFMHEPSLSESDSWLRALGYLAGLKKGLHE